MKLENVKKAEELGRQLGHLKSKVGLFEANKDVEHWPTWMEIRIQGIGEIRVVYISTVNAIAAMVKADVLRELAEIENEMYQL
jgi:hypothetical protein